MSTRRDDIPSLPGRHTDLMALALIALAIAATYGHTLGVPWYLDDLPVIVENPLLRDPAACLRRIFSPRGFANLTFALNYRFGGTAPGGYHLVNIAIHGVASGLVYLLLKRVFRATAWLPLLGALLFALHPLQTQAVTYVVQRMASLSGCLLFAALYLYVRGREEELRGGSFTAPGSLCCYLGALFCALLALLSKENAAVLPLLLWLFERCFLSDVRPWPVRLRYLAPFLLAPALYALLVVVIPLASGTALQSVTGLYPNGAVTSLRYLATEVVVVWVYIRLLVLPYGQALLYDYPLAATFFNWQSVSAALALGALGWGAWRWRRQAPACACGVAWFLLALALESSLFPLDPLFEHRLYVPLFGFVLVVAGLADLLPHRRSALAVLAVACLAGAVLTWQRNSLWTDQVAFFQDNLRKVPHSERVLQALAQSQAGEGQQAAAEAALLQSLRVRPNLHSYVNLLLLYEAQGRLAEGVSLARQGVQRFPDSARLNASLGLFLFRQGQVEAALPHLHQAVTGDPGYAQGHANLGRVYFQLKRLAEAEAAFLRALAIDAADAATHSDYAVVLHDLQRPVAARDELQQALRLDPNHVPSLFRAGLLAAESGDQAEAAAMLHRLRALNSPEATRLAREIALPR